MRFASIITVTLLAVSLCLPRPAHALVGDVLLYDDGGQIGAAVVRPGDTGPVGVYAPPVYTTGLRTIGGTFYSEDDPGFYSDSAIGFPALPASTGLFATAMPITHPDSAVSGNLWHWSGADLDGDGDYLEDVNFTAPPAGVVFRMTRFGFLYNELDGSNTPVPLFGANPQSLTALAVSDGAGFVHQHLTFSAEGGNQVLPALPPDGLYLLALQMSMQGMADSVPLYFVFSADYLRDNGNIIAGPEGPLLNVGSQRAALQWTESRLAHTFRWASSGATGADFSAPGNWAMPGVPAPHWKAILHGGANSGPTRVDVHSSTTVRSIDLAGGAEKMTLFVEPGVALDVTQRVRVQAGGVLLVAGEVQTGELAMADGSELEIWISGSGSGQVGKVSVLGAARLAGVIKPKIHGGFLPGPGDSFTILSAQAIEGTFDSSGLPSLAGILDWLVTYDNDSVVLAVVAQLLTGDANNDGAVTSDDLVAVQQNFGQIQPTAPIPGTAGLMIGDANDDGAVTSDDLIAVQQNFGNLLHPGGPEQLSNGIASSVPEPGAGLLMTLLLMTGNLRRRAKCQVRRA